MAVFEAKRTVLLAKYKDKDIHVSQTLDQSYYNGIPGTDPKEGHGDQVLTKAMRDDKIHREGSNGSKGDVTQGLTVVAGSARPVKERSGGTGSPQQTRGEVPFNLKAPLVPDNTTRGSRISASVQDVGPRAGKKLKPMPNVIITKKQEEADLKPDAGAKDPDKKNPIPVPMPAMQLMIPQLWLWQIDGGECAGLCLMSASDVDVT